MMATWLVTGGSGFLGGSILQWLAGGADSGSRVIALGRKHPGGWPREDFLRMDLDDVDGLCRAIEEIRPQCVIHAAGKTPPAPSAALYRANTRVTANLLAAMRGLHQKARIVLVGSVAELGPLPVEMLPVSETHPCRPVDAYGLSKWAATRLGLAEAPPLEVIAARVFNPIGPRLPTLQAFGRFASLLAETGPDPLILKVGSLETRRDFIDVQDVAAALVALVNNGRPGQVYNIATGQSRSIGDGLQELIRLSGRSVRIEVELSHRGPLESRADIAKIRRDTGWAPKVSWEESLANLWDDVRRRTQGRRVA